MVCAALLGADPNVITSEHTQAANETGQKVVQIHCEKTSCAAAGVACGTAACETVCNPGCQANGIGGCQSVCHPGCQANGKGGCKSGCKGGCCKHGCKHWCPLCRLCGGDDECDDDCDLNCCERRILTYCVGPGDLYPHYPYFPAYHGYYYFRPYNFEHVLKDSALAAEMGGDPRAPYSVEFLRSVFPPAPVEPIPEHVQQRLPILEDLLTPRRYTE